MPRSWYEFKAAANDSPPEILLFDEIGFWGIHAADFVRDLKGLGEPDEIVVRINSPGGEVPDGLAIHNALKRHKASITVYVDGLAASIASVIAMAGDRIIMPENTMMMIHDPWGVVVGTSEDMRGIADALDKMKAGLVSAYADKSGKDRDEIAELMTAVTWLTAAEAVDMGFADEIEKAVKVTNRFDLTRFEHPPKNLSKRGNPAPTNRGNREDKTMPPVNPQTPAAPSDPAANTTTIARNDAAEIARLCADGGVPAMTASLLAEGVTLDTAKARINAAGEVRNMVALARRSNPAIPENAADEAIKAGKTVEQVRATMFDLLVAKQDGQGAISSHVPVDGKDKGVVTAKAAGPDYLVDRMTARYAKKGG